MESVTSQSLLHRNLRLLRLRPVLLSLQIRLRLLYALHPQAVLSLLYAPLPQ